MAMTLSDLEIQKDLIEIKNNRISRSHKNILKEDDSIIRQSITYYNDFMENKTRANKELRKKLSRAHMPGHETKPDKKIWETSWKKHIKIESSKPFSNVSILKVISAPIVVTPISKHKKSKSEAIKKFTTYYNQIKKKKNFRKTKFKIEILSNRRIS